MFAIELKREIQMSIGWKLPSSCYYGMAQWGAALSKFCAWCKLRVQALNDICCIQYIYNV